MTGKDWEDLEAVEDTIERNEDRLVDGRPFYADPSPPVPEAKPLTTADFPTYMTAHWKHELLKAQREAQQSINSLRREEGIKAMNEAGGTGHTDTQLLYTWDKPNKPKRKHLQDRIYALEAELTKLKDDIADQDIQMWAVSRQGGAYAARITAVKVKCSKLRIVGTVDRFDAVVEIVAFRLLINNVTRSKDVTPSVTMTPIDSLVLTYDTDFLLPAGA